MSFWEKDGGVKPDPKALPVTSTDTVDEAKSLILRYCKRAYDDSGYIWPDFPGTIDALWAVSEVLEGDRTTNPLHPLEKPGYGRNGDRYARPDS